MYHNSFYHFIILYFNLLFHTCDIVINVFFFVEYLPEDGWKRRKHVGGLPYVCLSLYLIIVQLLEYIFIVICKQVNYNHRTNKIYLGSPHDMLTAVTVVVISVWGYSYKTSVIFVQL